MNRTQLRFENLQQVVGSNDMSIVLLTDLQRKNALTVMCDEMMTKQILMRLTGSGVCKTSLPEVLAGMMPSDYELMVFGVHHGQYQVVLVDVKSGQSARLNMCDAVLMHIIANTPFYIEEGLMMRQSVPYVENAPGMAIPVNAISKDMLQEALDKAVEDENYELAVHLRDEIERRNTSGREDGNERD
jgi:hypothetical protein